MVGEVSLVCWSFTSSQSPVRAAGLRWQPPPCRPSTSLCKKAESRLGIAWCICCPVSAKAWNCSSLHALHRVIHTCLHISFSPAFGRSIVSQLNWFLSSLFHHCCFCSPAPTLCPTFLLFSSTIVTVVTLPFTKPLKLVHLSVRFCSAWTGCVSIGLFPFLDVVEGNVSQLWVSACWEWGHPLGLCRVLFNESLSVSHWENSTKSVHHHCNS